LYSIFKLKAEKRKSYNKQNKMEQTYKYINVLDFESTCDGDHNDKEADIIKGKNFVPNHEIIEFPSVLLELDPETKQYNVKSEFDRFCKPLFNDQLTHFCKTLVGVTQEEVDKGVNFPTAYDDHLTWLHKQTNGFDGPIIFVTCGKWDLKTMLPMECVRWGLQVPPTIYRQVINLKDVFQKYVPPKPKINNDKDKLLIPQPKIYGMEKMLDLCDLELLGKHHRGIDDCRNIVRIVQHITNKYNAIWLPELVIEIDPSVYKINEKKKKAIDNMAAVTKRLINIL
jgi:inhibitor of KinA sporulation pathway (predicted exonuclease)